MKIKNVLIEKKNWNASESANKCLKINELEEKNLEENSDDELNNDRNNSGTETDDCLVESDSSHNENTDSLNINKNNSNYSDFNISVLKDVATLAKHTLNVNFRVNSGFLIESIILFNGIMNSPDDSLDSFKDQVVELTEICWQKGFNKSCEFVAPTIEYLLSLCLFKDSSKIVHLTHIWHMHRGLDSSFFDREDDSKGLKNLIILAADNLQFLQKEKGRKLMSFFMSLNKDLTKEIHLKLKLFVANAPKSIIVAIGLLYYRAWEDVKKNCPQLLMHFETECIQNLMLCTLHSPRDGTFNSLFARFLQVLRVFHSKKKKTQIEKLLLQLYEPILFRKFKVANGTIRANAVYILSDIFPLQDITLDRKQNEALLNNQMDLLMGLIKDPVIKVRQAVIIGLFTILKSYWVGISGDMIKAILKAFVQDIAWDVSSVEVRLCILKGFIELLDNCLTHGVLSNIFPKLCNLFHDNSEKVRMKMVELLKKVKGLQHFKILKIVPLDHLHYRLTVDSQLVIQELVSLLMDSYLPLDAPYVLLFERCLSLWRSNAAAARSFYSVAAKARKDLSFIVNFGVCILAFLNSKLQQSLPPESILEEESMILEMEQSTVENSDAPAMESLDSNAINVIANENLLEGLSIIDDTETAIYLCETAFLLFSYNYQELKENPDIYKCAVKQIAKHLPILMKYFNHPSILTALQLLASQFSVTFFPTVSCGLLTKLSAFEDSYDLGTNSALVDSLLELMVKWKKAIDVIELIDQWIVGSLQTEIDHFRGRKSSIAKAQRVRFSEPLITKPSLGLAYLKCLLNNKITRKIILQNNATQLSDLNKRLAKVKVVIKQRLSKKEDSNGTLEGNLLSDEHISELHVYYISNQVLLSHKDTVNTNNLLTNCSEWLNKTILPIFKPFVKPVPPTTTTRKRHHRRLLNASSLNSSILMDPDLSILSIDDKIPSSTHSRKFDLEAISEKSPNISQSISCSNTTSVFNDTFTISEVGEGSVGKMKQLACFILNDLFNLFSNLTLIGLIKEKNISQIIKFCNLLLKSDLEENIDFLLPISMLIVSMDTEFMETNDEWLICGNRKPLRELFKFILNCYYRMAISRSLGAVNLFTSIKYKLIDHCEYWLLQEAKLTDPNNPNLDSSCLLTQILEDSLKEIESIIAVNDLLDVDGEPIKELPLFSGFFKSLASKKLMNKRTAMTCFSEMISNISSDSSMLYIAAGFYLFNEVVKDCLDCKDLKFERVVNSAKKIKTNLNASSDSNCNNLALRNWTIKLIENVSTTIGETLIE